MKKTNIDMSLGDAIDRVTILVRKMEFGETLAFEELAALIKAINELNVPLTNILIPIIRLSYANFEVWSKENAFRRGEDMSAEDVKKMMIEVREFNKKRVASKNLINEKTDMGFKEAKVHHRSQ